MSNAEIKIDFPEASSAKANMLVDELKGLIEHSLLKQGMSGQLESRREKARHDTMDLGATLILILGTPAILAVARGIQSFIAKQNDKVVITIGDTRIELVGKSAENIDIAATMKALVEQAHKK